MAAHFIPRESKRKNVQLDIVIYHAGYSAQDGVNGLDFVQDALEGIAFSDDWQVLRASVEQRLYSGQDGVWLRFARVAL